MCLQRKKVKSEHKNKKKREYEENCFFSQELYTQRAFFTYFPPSPSWSFSLFFSDHEDHVWVLIEVLTFYSFCWLDCTFSPIMDARWIRTPWYTKILVKSMETECNKVIQEYNGLVGCRCKRKYMRMIMGFFCVLAAIAGLIFLQFCIPTYHARRTLVTTVGKREIKNFKKKKKENWGLSDFFL